MKCEKMYKSIFTYMLISVVLIGSLFSSFTLRSEAAILGNLANVTSEKFVDMALTQGGKVVNGDMRDDITTQLRNVLNGTAQSYWDWLEENGYENSTEKFREYLNSDAYASLPLRFVKFPLELSSFITWITTGETMLDSLGTDVEDVLTETDLKGDLSIPTESVSIVNQTFEWVRDEYTNGWRYIDVKPYDELPSTWFGTQNAFENARNYIKNGKYPTIVFSIWNGGESRYAFMNNEDAPSVVAKKVSDYRYAFYFYDSNWESVRELYYVVRGAIAFTVKDAETFQDYKVTYENTNAWNIENGYGCIEKITTDCYALLIPYGKSGEKIIVYDSLDALKMHSCGQTPYYLTNRQYSDSVDNSFNVSGEYLQNNGGTFSYEQIREQINNSNVTNDNSASTIINDYSQTIINNYSGTSSDSGSDGGGSSDSDSENGILNIIGAIGDVINFILNVVAEIISIIANFLTTIFELLKGLGSVFGSFSGLLGELFGFIPSEFIELLTTSMSAVVIIALWRKFSK